MLSRKFLRRQASPQLPSPAFGSFRSHLWQLDRAFPPPLPEKLPVSTEVQDRDGQLLRAFATPDGRWRLKPRSTRSTSSSSTCWSPTRTSASGTMTASTCWRWPRAAGQFVSNGHIVSGGSTLSMQLARLIEPRESRSLGSKLKQMLRAMQIERRLSKQRDPRPLSDAGALWRQSRRRARRIACLFRQGAAAADRLGSRPARRAAAIAGKAPARPQSASAQAARDRVLTRMVSAGLIGETRGRARRARRCLRLSAANCRRSPPTPPMQCCARPSPAAATS